jgi:hypothetical protein
MSETGRWLGLLLATAMLVFSGWIYLQTGDWVALVFVAGSMGYGAFFIVSSQRGKP